MLFNNINIFLYYIEYGPRNEIQAGTPSAHKTCGNTILVIESDFKLDENMSTIVMDRLGLLKKQPWTGRLEKDIIFWWNTTGKRHHFPVEYYWKQISFSDGILLEINIIIRWNSTENRHHVPVEFRRLMLQLSKQNRDKRERRHGKRTVSDTHRAYVLHSSCTPAGKMRSGHHELRDGNLTRAYFRWTGYALCHASKVWGRPDDQKDPPGGAAEMVYHHRQGTADAAGWACQTLQNDWRCHVSSFCQPGFFFLTINKKTATGLLGLVAESLSSVLPDPSWYLMISISDDLSFS